MVKTNKIPGITSSERRLTIVYRKIDQLKPNPGNPHCHDRAQRRRMTRLLKKYGFRLPVLIDVNGMLIVGHLRWEVARKLELKELPTILVDDLTDAEIRAFMLAENRISELSSWDDEALAEQFIEILRLNPDFDLESTCFDMGEIDLRIEGLASETRDGADAADELPDVAAGPSASRPGDLWLLGRHRVLCGNSLDASSYEALMQGEPAAMVFTDPPYNVPIVGHASGLGAVRHRDFAMASGEMDSAGFTTFLTQVAQLLARHSRSGALVYAFIDWRHIGEMLAAGTAVFGALLNLCVWAKTTAGMGSLYRSQHEFIFVFRNGCGRHRNNVQLGQYGRNRTNLWTYPTPAAFGRSGEEGKLLTLHPTVKPVALVADAIMDCTARGDVVLDPFLGSGTSIIAAERTGRLCFGLELDPGYVDTIVRRWQAYTRDSAHHAATGRSFDEVVAELEAQHGR